MELRIEAFFNSMALPWVVEASQFEGAARVRASTLRQEVLVGDRQALSPDQSDPELVWRLTNMFVHEVIEGAEVQPRVVAPL